MPINRAVQRCLLSAIVVLFTLAAITTATAGASYGELTHFGEAGPGQGQFTETVGTVAFGVDPTDNSVYVGDEPKSDEFRIQKLDSTGKFIAEARFKLGTEERPSLIEGIAVDPATVANPEGRVYVLGAVTRKPEIQPDPEVTAAGRLYAFKTQQTGTTLEPAAGKKEGVLASLQGESNTLGVALLEPKGIAVDPTTHDVIVMGKQDQGELEAPSLSVALERVSAGGVIRKPRWVDSTSSPFFTTEEATSPVVSAAGKVYVVGGELEIAPGENAEQIDEIPSSFAGTPKPLVRFQQNPSPGGHSFAEFPPGAPPPTEGGGLSISPEGTFYAYAALEYEEPGEHFVHTFGALAFSGAGSELGWTGGRPWTKTGNVPCAVSFLGHPVVAAGSGERVFMFDSNPEAPRVIEFGPGGSGCPTASASVPTAKVNGEPVVKAAPPGAEVVFSSTMKQANALSVEWSFGDGTTATVPTDEYETTQVGHKFTQEGTFTVTEKIHTDDLATPIIETSVPVTVEVPHPAAQFSSKTSTGSLNASFDAKNSTAPSGSTIAKYTWEFGDGTAPETRTTATIEHGYRSFATYTVKLTVTDSKGLTNSHQTSITLSSSPPPPPPPPPTTTNPAPTPTPAPTPPPSGGGGGEVLSYSASLAKTSLTVTKTGTVALMVDCAGKSICSGSVTLRTLSAVSAGKHKAILTLASASFTLSGGQAKSLTLHLSTKARALLARSHVLRARATILAHDSQGVMHTTQTIVTLRPQKAKHH
jgi:PKD repeat protein